MRHHLVVDSFPIVAEDTQGTVIARDPNDTKYRLQPPSKIVVKSSSETGSEIEHVLVYFGVGTKTNPDAKLKSHMKERTRTLQA